MSRVPRRLVRSCFEDQAIEPVAIGDAGDANEAKDAHGTLGRRETGHNSALRDQPPGPTATQRQPLSGFPGRRLLTPCAPRRTSAAPPWPASPLSSAEPRSSSNGCGEASHGDFASNLAMQLARDLEDQPAPDCPSVAARTAASRWCRRRSRDCRAPVSSISASAGRRKTRWSAPSCWRTQLRPVERRGRLQVEFVSANLTGPLHRRLWSRRAYGASPLRCWPLPVTT